MFSGRRSHYVHFLSQNKAALQTNPRGNRRQNFGKRKQSKHCPAKKNAGSQQRSFNRETAGNERTYSLQQLQEQARNLAQTRNGGRFNRSLQYQLRKSGVEGIFGKRRLEIEFHKASLLHGFGVFMLFYVINF